MRLWIKIKTMLSGNFFRRGNGAATRTRTADLMITNQLLYQLSYCGVTISVDLIITFLQALQDRKSRK